MTANLGQRIEQVVDLFAQRYARNPLDFLYESDIQAALHHLLEIAFEDLRFEIPPVPGLDLPRGQAGLSINPIKTEYPSVTRFDIAILDGDSSTIDRGPLSLWSLPCRAAIELKFWQVDGTGNQIIEDIRKLSDYLVAREKKGPFVGISLLFLQPSRPDRCPEKWISTFGPLGDDTRIPDTGIVAQLISVGDKGVLRKSIGVPEYFPEFLTG